MKKHLKIALVAVFILFAASITKAQEWSKEQTEVWKVASFGRYDGS